MPRKFILFLALGAVIMPLASGVPSFAQNAPPPPPQAEAVPAAPPRGAPGVYWVWRPGYWRWTGRAYRWVPGHYVHGPRAGAVWIPGEWVLVRGRYVWHPGHWRR